MLYIFIHFVYLLISSLFINHSPPISIVFDTLHISFAIECLLCFCKKIKIKKMKDLDILDNNKFWAKRYIQN